MRQRGRYGAERTQVIKANVEDGETATLGGRGYWGRRDGIATAGLA